MRWSHLFVPTLRQDPADADAPSHRLLLRAGYVRRLHAGHYSLLPLAVRVRARIIQVVREEMERAGAQEMLLPTLHPAGPWRRSGRWDLVGPELFRLADRRGNELALGMTHEEIFTTLALEVTSYRQLPQQWYQFQTKFRDEPRPRGGLVRVREFTMKDAYSFDIDQDGLDASFAAYRAAYIRIFERLGIPAVPVEASNGTMGGSGSTEFACPSESGEDTVVRCPACGYAANVETATSRLAPVSDDGTDPSGEAVPSGASGEAGASGAPEAFDTPGVRTIEDLAAGFGVPADRQIKTLVHLVDGRVTLVLLRGDHTLNEQKLADATGASELRPAEPEEIRAALGALPGSLGAVGVTGLPVVADEALRGRRGMVTGANRDGVHLRGVDVARDIPSPAWADLREVAAGEPCPSCGTPLEVFTAIEVGHIFKLGDRYTRALDMTVLGADGERVHPLMGSYGIGIERAMAAIVEVHHDEHGIVWPEAVAPFAVAVVPAQTDDPEVAGTAERIYGELRAAGVDAVLDDRPERAGVKFRDIELTGIPHRVTVGRRGLAQGVVEHTVRATRETAEIPVAEAVTHLRGVLAR
ncbi:proline--tRNA ligase [Actinomadura logoneensis]|uniref:Proline--tRNA ligase n=1 Tax=Actinomadura logoneensis TaxID=2293572 RepID=A0A372JD94_9ACTN|nr:proline--tRNA ligase [Actinomadura logoneensis]RFU37796.1 proline--tRNA ligase [Actinomadura logoneensis]